MRHYRVQLVITELEPPAQEGKTYTFQEIIREVHLTEWVLNTILQEKVHEALPRLRDRSSVNPGAAAPVFPA